MLILNMTQDSADSHERRVMLLLVIGLNERMVDTSSSTNPLQFVPSPVTRLVHRQQELAVFYEYEVSKW